MITSNLNNNYNDNIPTTAVNMMESISNQYYTIQYTYNSNSTSNDSSWNTIYTNYVPFQNQYVYDTGFQWRYHSDITGLREYMFANNLYKELGDILYDLFLVSQDEQDFEDSLYRNTLDLIYEFTRPEPAFNDLLNEELFGYRPLNQIICEVIEAYRSNFETEEF